MTHKEMSEIFAVMLLAYPNAEVFKGGIAKLGPTINLWVTCLPEIDFWTGQQAVVKLVRECKFPPTIAEFKEKAEKVQAEVKARIDQEWNYLKLDIVGIQMDADQHLIPVAPHPPCCLLANGERLLRRYLALTKALNAVVAHHLAPQTESPLDGDHLGISVLRRAIDTSHEHFAVGLIVVLCVTQGGVQILVQIFRGGGLVGIVGVVQRGFQIFEHRPESCHRHTASPLSGQQEFCCDVFQHR